MSFPPSVMSLVGMPQVFLCVCWCFLSCIVRRNWKLCLEISMAAKLLGVTPRDYELCAAVATTCVRVPETHGETF